MKIRKIALMIVLCLKCPKEPCVTSISSNVPIYNALLYPSKKISLSFSRKGEMNDKKREKRKIEKKEKQQILQTIHIISLLKKYDIFKAKKNTYLNIIFKNKCRKKKKKLTFLRLLLTNKESRSNEKTGNININKLNKYYYKNKKTKRGKLQMILAPKGSIHEKKTKEILNDPIKKYPWEISIPFHETITCEHNEYYNFLKSEWGYLDYKKDIRKPCGKIEGGLENYDGKGLKLEGGIDRPRFKKIPCHLDHGVEWRKFNADEMIRFDIDPDGNQDQTFLETEEDLEYRQWGNWNYNSAKETTQLNTAWRDPVLSKDLSNLIYPWSHKADENHPIPFGYRGPSGFIPEIRLEWELAARGFFGGYFDDPNWDRIKCYRMIKKLILEWHELEQTKRQIQKKQESEKGKKKKRKKNIELNSSHNTDENSSNNNNNNNKESIVNDNVGAVNSKVLEKITNRIEKIKMELFGISSKKKYSSKQIKLINEHALSRGKEILLDHILEPNNDPDYHTYYLDRNEPIDYIGGGNHNCSEKEIKNKTVVLNMCIYALKPQHETYSLKMSIEEMAEMYHYFMTEIRGEGRVHNLFEDPVESKYMCYELKKDRNKFPALVSLYKPLWTNQKYGEEFGDSLQPHEKVKKGTKEFANFSKKLKIKPKKRLTKKEMEYYNYVDDYEHFDEEYDF